MINAAIFINRMFSILGNHFSSRYFRFEIWIQSSVGVTKICYTDKKSLPFSQLFVGVWQRDFLWWGKAHVMGINVRSVVEFQRWWVLKSKIFGQESTYSKDFFKSVDELCFVKKCQNHTFKVNFRCQKSTDFCSKKII